MSRLETDSEKDAQSNVNSPARFGQFLGGEKGGPGRKRGTYAHFGMVLRPGRAVFDLPGCSILPNHGGRRSTLVDAAPTAATRTGLALHHLGASS